MLINKATWNVDGETITVRMPLCKVNQERRIVSGFASLDNPDSQDDAIDQEANRRAFSKFRGNIREMHQPIAVGRLISFREDEFYDVATNQVYNGIWVDAYVSKGAQPTWEKVLDGTLAGFSIGGTIKKSERQITKGSSKPIRVIKDYDLIELSLVDSPANPLANIKSIVKIDDNTVTGLIAETKSTNVFYCGHSGCEVAKTSTDDVLSCNEGHSMVNIGWFEYDDEKTKSEKFLKAIGSYLNNDKQVETAEGGVNMAEDALDKEGQAAEKDGDIAPVEQGKAETEADASVLNDGSVEEKSAVEETTTEQEEDDFEKALESINKAIDEGLTKNSEVVAQAVNLLNEKFDNFTSSVVAKFAELEAKATELTEKFAGLKDSVDKVEKSIEILEDDTAVKKSADLGGSTEKSVKTGLWSGSIL